MPLDTMTGLWFYFVNVANCATQTRAGNGCGFCAKRAEAVLVTPSGPNQSNNGGSHGWVVRCRICTASRNH